MFFHNFFFRLGRPSEWKGFCQSENRPVCFMIYFRSNLLPFNQWLRFFSARFQNDAGVGEKWQTAHFGSSFPAFWGNSGLPAAMGILSGIIVNARE